jgi:hypothetical protein
LVVSSANEDIVVSEPQNPIAIKREYFVSKFQSEDRTENIPRMKLPIIFTASTLIGSVLANNIDEETILYQEMPQLMLQLIEIQLHPYL